MIIVRLSPGLANQMYEYAASYALSRELNQELVLDISESLNGCKGFMLDEYSIPLSRKIIYRQQDAEAAGHEDLAGIPDEIKKGAVLFVQNREEKGTVNYQNLDMAASIKNTDKIYLCGYFFERGKYYKKYWDEIRQVFTLRYKDRNVEAFQTLIKDKVSVGIHVRRGDFIVSEWAEKLEDDYFKAAVECFRRKYKNPMFCVFSDDITYAKKILGKDSSIYYIHFLGYDDAAQEEFLCLSKCTHRILSNSSTFSSLADLLNWGKERHCFYKDVQNRPSSAEEVENFIKGGTYQREIRLNKKDIEAYSKSYRTDGKKNGLLYQEEAESIKEIEVTAENAKGILGRLARMSLNVYDGREEWVQELLYQKFQAQAAEKEYAGALQAAFCIYTTYAKEEKFRRLYTNVLCACGFYEEALIESLFLDSSTWNKMREEHGLTDHKWEVVYKLFAEFPTSHFLIVPYTKSLASSKIYGLTALGQVLYHAGHKVSFVFEPMDKGEEYYIRKNPILKNRQEVTLGGRQYLLSDIEKQGYTEFLRQFGNENLIVLSRRKEFFVVKEKLLNKKTTYVYPTFGIKGDPETPAARRNGCDESVIAGMADIVFEQEMEDIGEKNYHVIEESWSLTNQNRLSVEVIHRAAALLNKLQN